MPAHCQRRWSNNDQTCLVFAGTAESRVSEQLGSCTSWQPAFNVASESRRRLIYHRTWRLWQSLIVRDINSQGKLLFNLGRTGRHWYPFWYTISWPISVVVLLLSWFVPQCRLPGKWQCFHVESDSTLKQAMYWKNQSQVNSYCLLHVHCSIDLFLCSFFFRGRHLDHDDDCSCTEHPTYCQRLFPNSITPMIPIYKN